MAFNLNKKARSINNKKPHGGKVKGFGLAAGDAENTGMPVTPAPTRKIAPDVISAPRAATEGHGYGMSPGNNPSVIPTGTQLLSPMAEVLREAQDDGEDVLGKIIERGVHTDDGWQVRDLNETSVPVHPNAKRQTTPSKIGDVVVGTLPATCGASAAKDPTDPNA